MPLNEDDRRWIEAIVKPIVDLQQEHHRTLFGDGSEGHQGLRLDVHDLKADVKRRNWILTGISLPALGVIGMKIWDFITFASPRNGN